MPKTTKKRALQKNLTSIYVPVAKKYHCTMCGTDYDDYKSFMAIQSPLYKENNGRTTVCYECLAKLWEQNQNETGSPVKGFEKLCRQIDMYFDPVNYKKMMDSARGYLNRLKKYVSLTNLAKGKNKTYTNTITENKSKIGSKPNVNVELVALAENEQKEIADYEIKYGKGFSHEEYKTMDINFDKIKQQMTGDSASDDIIINNAIANACTMLILRDRAILANDEDKAIKFTEAYTKALTGKDITNYMKKKETLLNANDCQGMWIKDVETTCPAEIYTDRGVYSDHRKHNRYMKRHFFRSIKNFFTGTYVPDEQYNIGVD